ncbi:MAG TPA: tyrosine-type recombinase/integrase [Verrucomicrobiae bacterium]|nr:tyrosine-type recombinase/integrase [Verrucomicrobiae bacterium]
MALGTLKLDKLKPKAKLFRVADGSGLCIEVHPSGAKYWRYRYRFAGKAKMISLGPYPDVGLSEARDRREAAARQLRDGKDPSTEKQRENVERRHAHANTFRTVASEWLAKQKDKLATATYDKATWLLEDFAYPWLGDRAIAEIDAPTVLATLRRVESRGKLETAHRLKQKISQVFRYAVATGRAKGDPVPALKGALETPKAKHHASIKKPDELGTLLRALQCYGGSFVTACALKLAPLVFVRPGELRHAEWTEIDLDAAEWRIPAAKMKMRSAHIVPLSAQAVSILRELQALTGRGKYVFPGVRTNKRPMSENTVNSALRGMGYASDQMTGHGFRSTASTMLHEMGWDSAVIERQLAHAERNTVKAAYNHAEYLPERRKMMQAWSDYLTALEKHEKVVAGRFGAAA